MSLYTELPRLVDAEQVNVAAGCLPTGRRWTNIFDLDWIVRPLTGPRPTAIAVYRPAEFLARHLAYLEACDQGVH